MNKNHSNCFFAIRLYAAFCILIGHAATHLNISVFGYTPDSDQLFHFGVQLFFILSAFFLFKSFEKSYSKGQSIFRYYWGRLVRIAPPVYAYIIFSTIILLAIGALSINVFETKQYWAWFISNLALLPVYFPITFQHIGVGVLNGSLWTIVAQLGFYLILPVIYWCYKKIGFRKTMALFFGISIVTLFVYSLGIKYASEHILFKLYKVSFVPHLLFFMLGILWSKTWEKVPKNVGIFLVSLIFYIIIKEDIVRLKENYYGLWMFLWSVPFSYIIIWFGYNGPKFLRKLNHLEDISMGIYIWHMVIINVVLFTGVHKLMSDYLTIFMVMLLTIVMAVLSYRLVEKPSLRLRNIKVPYLKKNLKIEG